MSDDNKPTEPDSAPSPPATPAADYRAPVAPVDDPSKRPPPGTTIARVGDRYRLTYGFVERWLKRYGWHVRRKSMPTAIRDRLHGQGYGKAVNAKSDYLLEQVAGVDSTTADERTLHGAFCSVASAYGFPPPPRPVFPDDPPPPPGKGKGKGGGQKPDPAQKPDAGNGDGENEGDGEGEGQPDNQPQQGNDDGQGQDGGQDGQPDQSPGDGGGDQPQPDEGEGEGGDGENEGEPSPPSDGKAGGGFSHGTPKNDGLDYRPDYGDAEDEVEGDGAEESEPTIQPDLGDLRSITAPPPPPPQQHPIGRIPTSCIKDRRNVIETGGFNALLAKLREELMSVARHKRTYDRDSGDLDFRKMVDLATGQGLDRIYCQTTHAQRLNTAVQLFVDFSGSMEGGRLNAANSLSVLLTELFEKLRIPCEVVGFTDDAYLMKAWEERVGDCSPLGRLKVGGGTNLFRSMQTGLSSLLRRRESRLIQAVITDGEINDYEGNACRKLLAADRRLETYGFFIQMPDNHQPFLRSVDHLTPQNMVEKILTTLGHVVAGGPRQARAA